MTAVLNEGSLSPKEAEKLRGRILFFEGYIYIWEDCKRSCEELG